MGREITSDCNQCVFSSENDGVGRGCCCTSPLENVIIRKCGQRTAGEVGGDQFGSVSLAREGNQTAGAVTFVPDEEMNREMH